MRPAHAVAVFRRVIELAGNRDQAAARRGPAANHGVLLVIACMTARGVENRPADLRIGQGGAPLPGRTGEVRQRRELYDAVLGGAERAVAVLPYFSVPRVLFGERLHRRQSKVARSFCTQTLRKLSRMLEHEVAVHQHQRLRRAGARDAPFAIQGHHRRIEGGQERDGLRTPHLQIHAAARGVVFHHHLPDEIFFHRNGRTELRAVQLAADGQNAISQDLRFQTPHRIVPVVSVIAVDGSGIDGAFRRGPGNGRLTIRGRKHDLLVQLLQTPALPGEFTRQPVDQLRMRRYARRACRSRRPYRRTCGRSDAAKSD